MAFQPDLRGLDTVPLHVTPATLVAKAVAQASALPKGLGPHIFGANVALPVSLEAGRWDALDGETLRWRSRVNSAGALALALEFGHFRMPEGGALWVYDGAGQSIAGPYTHANQTPERLLWTALVLGDTAIIEARVPVARRAGFELQLSRIGHAFLDPYKADIGPGASGRCNHDVVCPAGIAWATESRATVRLQIPVGTNLGFCTGTMVNNVRQDNRNLILTADHCEIGESGRPASGVVVYWKFQNSVCRSTQNGSESISQSGTTLLAEDEVTDMTLLELVPPLRADADVHYAGWDSAGGGANSGATLHHPRGDAKKVSLFDTPLTHQPFQFGPGDPVIPTWRVDHYTVGTTEPGSSGAALWNQDHRIIGTLSGGGAACPTQTSTGDDNNEPDFFARLERQWAASPELRAALNPDNTAVRCLTGKDPATTGAACTPGSLPPPTPEPETVTGGGGGGAMPSLLVLLVLPVMLRLRRPRRTGCIS